MNLRNLLVLNLFIIKEFDIKELEHLAWHLEEAVKELTQMDHDLKCHKSKKSLFSILKK